MPNNCAFCNQEHMSKLCTKYIKIQDRNSRIKELKLCNRCLRSGHFGRSCNRYCGFCKDLHHISICYKLHKQNNDDSKTKVLNNNVLQTSTKNIQSTKTLSAISNESASILQTAKIRALGLNGNIEKVNVLFDQGSQVSFITEFIMQKT